MALLRNPYLGDDPTDCDDEPEARCTCGDEDCDGGPECPVTAAEIAKLAEEDLAAMIASEAGYEGWTCSVCDGPAPAGEPACSPECENEWHVRLDRAEAEEMFQ